jgi:uncharacterized protein (UPF0335 family)
MTADLMGNKSGEELAGFIERIESLEAEKKQAGEKIKAEYDTAAGAGFDKKAIKALLKERRGDVAKTIELRAVINAYRAALARRVGNALGDLGDWARSWGSMESKMSLAVKVEDAEASVREFTNTWDKMFPKGKPTSGKDAASGDGASP